MRLFIILLCLSASLKDDADMMASSDFLSGITTLPAVVYLKSASPLELAAAFLVGLVIVLKNFRLKLKGNFLATMLLLLSAYSCGRAFAYDLPAGLKLLEGFLIVAFVTFVVQSALTGPEPTKVTRDILQGLRIFCGIFIAVNFVNYALGFGYAPSQPRFFGTAVHPNFLGVQLASANLLLLSGVRRSRLRSALVPAFFILAGIWLQLLTGSRTSLLMLMVGGLALTWLNLKKHKALVLMFGVPFVLCAIVAAASIGSSAPAGVFTRGSEGPDTRSEAWGQMIAEIVAYPIFGQGYFVGASENSTLRAMAAFGIIFGLIFAALLLFSAYRLHRYAKINTALAAPFFALMSALIVASLFEGSLMDTWSLPKFLLVLMFALCGRASFLETHAPNAGRAAP